MTRERYILGLLATFLSILLTSSTSWAAPDGRYRIELMNGKYVEGEVKELPDGSYEVKTKYGAIVTVRKNEVRTMRALEEAGTAPGSEVASAGGTALRRPISDAEIEQLLADIVARPDESLVGADRSDMMAPLPLNENSLQEMLREAGADRQKNVLEKDHFVMVYTASEKAAQELAARLEAVYRWNVRFMEMMKLPARRPAHKLEIYFFGTFKEYEAYSANHGMTVSGGGGFALGYYMPEINRSHFFDMNTFPPVAQLAESVKDKSVPWERRQEVTNRIRRWVEYQNVEVIQHEIGHHIHFNIGLFPRDSFKGGNVPIWLVEGTTMMFEVPPSKAGASLGTLNDNRLDHLLKKFGKRPLSVAEWKLFLIDNTAWHNAAGRGNTYDSYQLAWSMVYYLWKERRDQYAKYLQTVFGREPGVTMTNTEREKDFEDAFGRLDEKWLEGYYQFLSTLHVRQSLLPPELGSSSGHRDAGGQRQQGGKGGGGRRPGG